MSDNWLDIYGQLDFRGLWLAAPWPERLIIGGADCKLFLQNFCTNDVLRMPAGGVIEAFFLNTKGHILAHGLLNIREEDVVIYPIGSKGTHLADHLTRYVIREQVEIQVLETPYWLAIGGPWAAVPAPSENDVAELPQLVDCELVPFPMLHQQGWIVETAIPPERLEVRLEGAGYFRPEAESVSTVVFDALRIESGLPIPQIDYPPGTLPQELDRNQRAIHFGKGCYLGQETVARLDALGHVNKVLRGVGFAEDNYPYPGITISGVGREVGTVTSLTYSPRLQRSLGMSIVRREAAESGTNLSWSNGSATVVALPLAVPGANAS